MIARAEEVASPMNFVYSTTADALYIELESPRRVARTVEVSPSCLVDLNESGQPIGIELLNPSTAYAAITDVIRRWQGELEAQQIAQLLAYPYPALTPQRPAASSAARVRVRVGDRRQDDLLTCA